jgi:diguanylate cyclase (GGDEF)-like protein
MSPESSRTRILLVCDDPAVSEHVIRHLDDALEIQVIENMYDALSSITYNLPTLIITYDNPDGYDSIKLLKTIRHSIKTKLIPFIILSPDNGNVLKLKAYEEGADIYLRYPDEMDEFRASVSTSINKFQEFYLLTITDELTRLYNRKEFIHKFRQLIINRPDITISLVILDIDHFKHVNDTFGHQTGDRVLMKLAEILKEITSPSFFPARFGGEEFVVLMPGIDSEQARERIRELLEFFSSIVFEHESRTFSVSFSAGIATYPLMARNVSELLTRADQALYHAKEDGRNRIYIFNSMMLKKDRFWEYLKPLSGIYTDEARREAITGRPFLPVVLDQILSLDFQVRSIGVLIIETLSIFDREEQTGYDNYRYNIENLNRILARSCQMTFPSDTYISISDFFEYEFIILFPSVVDFSINIKRFQEICQEIVREINYGIRSHYLDIKHASGVFELDTDNPRHQYRAIQTIRQKKASLTNHRESYKNMLASLRGNQDPESLKEYFCIHNLVDKNGKPGPYACIQLAHHEHNPDLLNMLVHTATCRHERILKLIEIIPELDGFSPDHDILIPLPCSEQTPVYLDAIYTHLDPEKAICLLNASDLKSFTATLAEKTLRIGIDNCYINSTILWFAANHDIDICLFSEEMVRNIHLFKERIKLLSSMKLFMDQLSVPVGAKNIESEEEYQVLIDLGIQLFSGDYFTSMKGNKTAKSIND